jgi:alkylation response protein AidB-like acyl-CoA dehydrogenase
VIGPAAGDNDQTGGWPDSSIQALSEVGLIGIPVPVEFGGLGLGPSDIVAVTEEIAAACASTGMIFVMHVCATEVIKNSKIPDRASLLSDISGGKHLSTLALSERGSRSHFWAPVSQAIDGQGKHILNCEKSRVTSAGHAASYVVSTRSRSAESPTDSAL